MAIQMSDEGLRITFCHSSYPFIFKHIFALLCNAPELRSPDAETSMAALQAQLYITNEDISIPLNGGGILFINHSALETLFDIKRKVKNDATAAAQSSNAYSLWAGAEKSLLSSEDEEEKDDDAAPSL